MKKIVRFGFVIMILTALTVGCAKDEPTLTTTDYRKEYLGVWDCNEIAGVNHPQFYSVQIDEDSTSNGIIIRNLYQQGTSVKAVISSADFTFISIPNQSSGGILFSGSGKANVSFDQITLDFMANDQGSGADNVEAILSR